MNGKDTLCDKKLQNMDLPFLNRPPSQTFPGKERSGAKISITSCMQTRFILKSIQQEINAIIDVMVKTNFMWDIN